METVTILLIIVANIAVISMGLCAFFCLVSVILAYVLKQSMDRSYSLEVSLDQQEEKFVVLDNLELITEEIGDLAVHLKSLTIDEVYAQDPIILELWQHIGAVSAQIDEYVSIGGVTTEEGQDG